MILHRAEGASGAEAPSQEGVRESEDSVVHPTTTPPKYTPGVEGEKCERWGMVPLSALTLPKAHMRVLFAYSSFANRHRVAIVGENRIAQELGWFYGRDKTPNRRNVNRIRTPLIELGFMVDAGIRQVPGHKAWVRSYLVAPYTQAQFVDLSMRQFLVRDASTPTAPMRPRLTHIQKVQTIEQTDRPDASSPLRGSRPSSPDEERSEEEEEQDAPWVMAGLTWQQWAQGVRA